MKSLRIAVAVSFLISASAVLAQTSAQKSFDQLKSLTGSWEGKNSEGKPLHVAFRDTAGGSALMSEIEGQSNDHGHEDMVSMIHMDGPNRLVLTHYCSAGNQPRMAATTSPDGKTFTFDFFDGTNIPPAAGHMQRVVITILDPSHHTEDWTFAAGPGKEMKEFFDLHRAEVAQK
jgi:hypothetical protein